ncbi:MAG: hypothetical protein EOL87_07300 [Spartobacteria bacterium]|nr:hypothetical protein [Spartobacteria bacterium]
MLLLSAFIAFPIIRIADVHEYRLDHLIKRKGRTFEYLYDFGDDWRHELTLLETNFIDEQIHSDNLIRFPSTKCSCVTDGGVAFVRCRGSLTIMKGMPIMVSI